jgi:hypothetical protein
MKMILGGILVAIGILIAGGSGLCSLMVLFSSGGFADPGMLPLVLLIGGVPFVVGAGIAFGGHVLIRSARAGPNYSSDSES